MRNITSLRRVAKSSMPRRSAWRRSSLVRRRTAGGVWVWPRRDSVASAAVRPAPNVASAAQLSGFPMVRVMVSSPCLQSVGIASVSCRYRDGLSGKGNTGAAFLIFTIRRRPGGCAGRRASGFRLAARARGRHGSARDDQGGGGGDEILDGDGAAGGP